MAVNGLFEDRLALDPDWPDYEIPKEDEDNDFKNQLSQTDYAFDMVEGVQDANGNEWDTNDSF